MLCQLEDKCIPEVTPCAPNSKCDTNPTTGEAVCTCSDGYKGAYCFDDIDECGLGKISHLLIEILLKSFSLLFDVN